MSQTILAFVGHVSNGVARISNRGNPIAFKVATVVAPDEWKLTQPFVQHGDHVELTVDGDEVTAVRLYRLANYFEAAEALKSALSELHSSERPKIGQHRPVHECLAALNAAHNRLSDYRRVEIRDHYHDLVWGTERSLGLTEAIHKLINSNFMETTPTRLKKVLKSMLTLKPSWGAYQGIRRILVLALKWRRFWNSESVTSSEASEQALNWTINKATWWLMTHAADEIAAEKERL